MGRCTELGGGGKAT